MAKTCAQAVVHGFVQGVGFRAWTERQALALELEGWVKNLPNGDVEVLIEGEKEAVDQMLEALHHGPALSLVREVKVKFEPYQGAFAGFEVRY